MVNKSFLETLLQCQKEVEKELKGFFQEKISRSERLFKIGTLESLKEFSLRPAKRIRPILVSCGYFLAGGTDKKAILEAAISVELLHNMVLIHDDIIDKDEFRRGEKTIHRLFGIERALVMGDIVGFLGVERLNSSDFPAENRIAAISKLNQTLIETGYGQILEMRPEAQRDILEAYRLKTALYSFVGPLQIGALLARAKEDFLCKIERFALPLGMAFQIQDDLHDDGDSVGETRQKQRLVHKYINQSKEVLLSEESFPQREKQFLLGLADYIQKGEY